MTKWWNRQRKTGRRAPFRQSRHRILVLCVGTVTEPGYLKGFVRKCGNPLVEVDVFGSSDYPINVVDEAKKRKAASKKQAERESDSNLEYDEVWAVFDVDDKPENIRVAVEKGEASGILLAISNPCFELWLLLHFQEPPGILNRHQALATMKEHIKGYDKHVKIEDYIEGYPDAVNRAKKLAQSAIYCQEPRKNPTTNVYELTNAIESGGSDLAGSHVEKIGDQ